jgi:hypothetical protein
MKDCRHHQKPEGPWGITKRFLQSPQGSTWLVNALNEFHNRKLKEEQESNEVRTTHV